MASKIKAIGAYRPRIEQGNTVQKPELTLALAGQCKGPRPLPRDRSGGRFD